MERIEQEKRVVELMIRMYCRHRCKALRKGKGRGRGLCAECTELLEYAHARLSRCRFGEGKPTCRKCPVHCYRRDMRERIRTVMRWAGPRMMLYHPVLAVRHMISELK